MDRSSAVATGQRQPLYCPVPTGAAATVKLAKRPASIAGRRVGFLGNLKPNCDVLLHTTQEQLSSLGAAATLYLEKESCSLGAASSILDQIAGSCDLAVVALGD